MLNYLARCLNCGCEVEPGEELCSYCLAKEQKTILRNKSKPVKIESNNRNQRTKKRNTKPRKNE